MPLKKKVNEAIDRHLPVTCEFMTHEEAKSIVDLSKLPENASETLRIVRIGDYDACACIGQHVENTSEIGLFKNYQLRLCRRKITPQIQTDKIGM